MMTMVMRKMAVAALIIERMTRKMRCDTKIMMFTVILMSLIKMMVIMMIKTQIIVL